MRWILCPGPHSLLSVDNNFSPSWMCLTIKMLDMTKCVTHFCSLVYYSEEQCCKYVYVNVTHQEYIMPKSVSERLDNLWKM